MPERPWKPAICQPTGAVWVTAFNVLEPPDSVRPVFVVKRAKKILVRPLNCAEWRVTEVRYSPGANVSCCAVPPPPPWVNDVPSASVRPTWSTREPARRLTPETRCAGGSEARSVNASPCGPPHVSLSDRAGFSVHRKSAAIG